MGSIAKSVDTDGDGAGEAVVERYVHDGAEIALVFDGEGNQTERFFHGVGIDEVLASERANSEVLWSLSDHQDSVRVLLDNDGNVVNQISYDAFGNITNETDADVNFRFSYTGRELDKETDNYYYRARYYDPATGSFISEDPIGFDGGDDNLYRYVGNSPINFTDPLGLFTVYKGNPIVDSFFPPLRPLLRKIPGIDNLDLDINVNLGEKFGEKARDYYVDQYLNEDNSDLERAAAFGAGAFASLWTCDTSNDTFDTLLAGLSASKFASQTKVKDLQKGLKNLKDDLNDFLRGNKNNKTPSSILGCGSSFIAGTEVLTPDGLVNIEDIEVGDWVISDDPETPGEVVAKQVTRTFERSDNNGIYDVSIGDEIISSTGNHDFWIDDRGWIQAKDLEQGDLLQTEDGDFVSVNSIEVREETVEVYNFEVEDFHTYFVSENEILVHNANCDPLLPGELDVGSYKNLKNAGSRGDNITPHHIPSDKHMSQYGVKQKDGIAINMEHKYPINKGRHPDTFTYGPNNKNGGGDVNMTSRDALAAGIRDAKKIYSNDNLYDSKTRKALQEVVRQNKNKFPLIFKKK